MDSDVHKQIKREYDIKRQRNIEFAKQKKDQIYTENPKLEEIENKKHTLAIKSARIMLNSDEITRQIEAENISLKLSELEKKEITELKKIGLKKEDFEPHFECNICKDTGIIKEDNKSKFCNCFVQAVINATYKQSNMSKIEEENFETFDICYYSKKSDKEKYGTTRTPMENIECIRGVAKHFCENIDSKEQKNLLFVGNTGLGKTFIANCIAKEVIDNGKTVVYQTAPILMDKVIEYKFSYNKSGIQKEQYDKIFEVDLLIIDDLGTETMSNVKFTELFNIINTRLLKNKKILISTNLTLNELYKEYDERVMSRLIGNFTICKFIGDDIRLKKKRIK
ncbi:MAG: ATP-binding protein [Clostridia bacterium]